MVDSAQPTLKFYGVNIIEVRFNAEKKLEDKQPLLLEVLPIVSEPPDDKSRFNVIMEVTIKCEEYFELFVKGVGFFEMGTNATKEEEEFIKAVNAPTIMFPYIRSFISTFSANTGGTISSILIPTQFFTQRIVESETEEKTQ